MIKPISGLILICLACCPLAGMATLDPETSLVEIEVTKKVFDYRTPWFTRNQQVSKNGIIIGDQQILTTADGLSGQYLCRIKKGGVSRQYTAEVVWVDFYANVAVLDVPEEAFWEGMQAVALTETIPQGGELQIYRWQGGRIEQRAAEVVRLFSGQSKTSYVEHLVLRVASTIQSAGWAEAVFDEDQLVGLTASAGKDTLNILPAEFIAKVIDKHRQSKRAGLGYFDFKSISAKNPALLASKGLDLRDVGVVVTEIGGRGLGSEGLQIGDVILEIDGFKIDSEGMYLDPDYGRLSYGSLATRAHFAGEEIPFRVWRAGKDHEINYRLPGADFYKDTIPEQRYDAPPQYLIAGGLLFQPLNGPLMEALGKATPVLLEYYSRKELNDEREGLVVLSGVLPDDFNLGYEGMRYLLLDQVNGKTIHTLEDVVLALENPDGAFHRIRFMHDERVIHMVLDAAGMEAATSRILQTYRIPSASQL